jgi:hypothetical protein
VRVAVGKFFGKHIGKHKHKQTNRKQKNTQKIQNSFATQFKTNWLFDIELLFRLKKEKASILEYPLRKWIDKKGSKVTGVRNYLQILRDLWILLKD